MLTGQVAFNSLRGIGIFIFIPTSKTDLYPTKPPFHSVPRHFLQKHEAEQLPAYCYCQDHMELQHHVQLLHGVMGRLLVGLYSED